MADRPARSNWERWTVGLLLAALAAVSALSLGASSQTPFSDVDETHPRHSDITYAAARGWFQGYPDGTFQPDRPITPAQTARIIQRAQPELTRSEAAVLLRAGIHALQQSNIQVTDTTLAPPEPDPETLSAGDAFSDVDETHPQYPDIAYAAEQGWFQGYPDGTFQPDRPITPAQTARIIQRARPELTRSEAAVFLRAGIHALQQSGIQVTDTTLAPPPEPTTTTAPTTTTTTAPFTLVTRAPAPDRVSHPTWDNRLPSTWDGIEATECNNTLRNPIRTDPTSWDYWWGLAGAHFVLSDESWVIAEALQNPYYKATGPRERKALANLGLTTAQDIRGIGEGAADVRWYAFWLKEQITLQGDPNHPNCASILAGADAVLNAPLTITTTATTEIILTGPRRVHHPTWDNRLPLQWADTKCHETFKVYPANPPHWNYWYERYGYHGLLPHESAVIAAALRNPAYEPAPGTPEHAALANLGLTTTQDIRGIGENAVNIRWYAAFVKDTIPYFGDPKHPDCAKILAGANAVLNAPYTTTTTTTTAAGS